MIRIVGLIVLSFHAIDGWNPFDKQTKPFVAGGMPALTGQFPYQAGLMKKPRDLFCGSTIISPIWVISAAHCTMNKVASQITVSVGSTAYDKGELYDVHCIHNHPQYDRATLRNDISLIQTIKMIAFSQTVKAAIVGTNFVGGGTQGDIVGLGAAATIGAPSYNLNYFKSQTISNEHCANFFRGHGNFQADKEITEDKLCLFSQKSQETCQRDSGGGFYVHGSVVGIASWNKPCGLGFPDVFERIETHVDWIRDVQAASVSRDTFS